MDESFADVLERMRNALARNEYTREEAIALIGRRRDRFLIHSAKCSYPFEYTNEVVAEHEKDIDTLRNGGMISIVSYTHQGARVVD